MINLKFKYLEKECSISCQKTDKMKQICQQYATQNKIDFLSKIFIHNNRKINLKNNFSISKLLNIENSNKITFEIIVFDDPDKELITRTAIYNGEEIKIQSRKNENIMKKLSNIFSKQINKFFVLSQGDIITNEAKFNQLPDAPILINDNEERNSINSNGGNNLPLIPDVIKNNDNNNNNNNSNNNDNNIQNDKIYNPPNEKIYMPPNEKIELEDKDEKDEKEEENNIKVINEDENGRRSSLRFTINDDDNIYKLRNIFLFLIIQFTIIFSFVYFGFLYKINEIFISGLGPILGTFIPTTVVVLLLAIVSIGIIDDEDDSICSYFSGYSFYIVYIVSMTFFCFLLSLFTEQKYILCGLSQILYQFFAVELYFLIFRSTNINGFFFTILIINIISFLCFYFFWINERIPIIILYYISFVYMIYLTIVFSIWRSSYQINTIQIYIVVFFNFSIFFVVDCLIALLFFLLIYLPIKVCRTCCNCCDDCCCDSCDCCDDC